LKKKYTISFIEDILYPAQGGNRILPKRLKPPTNNKVSSPTIKQYQLSPSWKTQLSCLHTTCNWS